MFTVYYYYSHAADVGMCINKQMSTQYTRASIRMVTTGTTMAFVCYTTVVLESNLSEKPKPKPQHLSHTP